MSTNYIDQITDTAGTTHDISEGDSTRIFRATCPTAAATAAKVATLQTSDRNFSLTTGVRVAVTFQYGNSAATPTLNVNNTGAKNIVVSTEVNNIAAGNGTTFNTWGAYETIIFTYNGSYWKNNSGSGLALYNTYALANSKTSNTGTITGVKTTAGAHTTIDISSGAANFNVPTKTSHLTNDSGFITVDSDEKLTIEGVLDSTTTTYTYYPILARKGTANGIRQIDETGFRINNRNGSADNAGFAELILGNSTAEGTEGNKRGWISIYNRNDKYAVLYTAASLTANREIALPDKNGTIALTSDIPTPGTEVQIVRW